MDASSLVAEPQPSHAPRAAIKRTHLFPSPREGGEKRNH
jgi:hypothetical protein